MKVFKLFLFFTFMSVGLCHAITLNEMQPDSAKYKWVKGQKYLLHKVQAKETWNSVSRKYNMPINDLMKSNLGVIDLKIGQILNIPSESIVASAAAPKEETAAPPVKDESKSKTAIIYTVRNSETLFGIAKKFDTSVDLIKKWNNLESDNVSEGQKLVVSYMYSSLKEETKKTTPEFLSEKPKEDGLKKATVEEVKPSAPEPIVQQTVVIEKSVQTTPTTPTEVAVAKKENTKPVLSNVIDNPTRSMLPVGKVSGGKTLMQVTESGISSWIADGDVNQNKYYGLHRSAPIGTIVKVTNKMNHNQQYWMSPLAN